MEQEKKQGEVIDLRSYRNQDGQSYIPGAVAYATTARRSEEKMDDLLRVYIEKVDRDQNALRDDIREYEKRIDSKIEQSESRMDKRLARIEEMISNQNKQVEEMMNNQNNKFENLKEKVSEKIEDDKKYRHSNNIAIVLGVVATVIAMVSIYFATVSSITDIISILK